jgi:HlyD family secretion protein
LEEAKAGVAAAQAQYDNNSGDYQEALLNQAKARQNQIQYQLEKTNIASPVEGIILHRHMEIGEIVKPGATVFTVLKKGELQVVVYVPEANLNQVKVGQEATIKVDAYPDQSFTGKITHISNKAEFTPKNVQTPEERTKMVFAVTIKVTKGINELKPGMPADVTFPTATSEGK